MFVQRKGGIYSLDFTGGEQEHIRTGLCRFLDESVVVRFEPNESIPPEKPGKYRWVMSEAKYSWRTTILQPW